MTEGDVAGEQLVDVAVTRGGMARAAVWGDLAAEMLNDEWRLLAILRQALDPEDQPQAQALVWLFREGAISGFHETNDPLLTRSWAARIHPGAELIYLTEFGARTARDAYDRYPSIMAARAQERSLAGKQAWAARGRSARRLGLDQWNDVLPVEIARAQANWERGRLVDRMAAVGMSREDVASRLSISLVSVSNWKRFFTPGDTAPITFYFGEAADGRPALGRHFRSVLGGIDR